MEQINKSLSYAFAYVNGIDGAVQVVNGADSSLFTAEELAGQWAFDAAAQDRNGMSHEIFVGHLQYLRAEGAKFDMRQAAECAADLCWTLWWTSEDGQSSLAMGQFAHEDDAMEAVEAAQALLIEQSSSDEERAGILAGRWSAERKAA